MVLGPRIVRRPVVAVDARCAHCEFNSLGLPQDHHSCPTQLERHGGIGIRDGIAEATRSRRGGKPLDIDDILNREGNTVQRPPVLARPKRDLRRSRRGQGPIGVERPESIELAIEGIHPREQMLHQLNRRKATGVDLIRQFGDRAPMHRGVVHARYLAGQCVELTSAYLATALTTSAARPSARPHCPRAV